MPLEPTDEQVSDIARRWAGRIDVSRSTPGAEVDRADLLEGMVRLLFPLVADVVFEAAARLCDEAGEPSDDDDECWSLANKCMRGLGADLRAMKSTVNAPRESE